MLRVKRGEALWLRGCGWLTWYSKDFIFTRFIAQSARLLLHQSLIIARMIRARNTQNFKITHVVLVRFIGLVVVFFHLIVLVGNFILNLSMLQIEFLEELHNFLLMLVCRRVLLDGYADSHSFAQAAGDGARTPSTPVA